VRIKPTKGLIALLGGALGLLLLATAGIAWAQNGALSDMRLKVQAKQTEVRDGQSRERRREEALDSLEKDRERLRFLESAVSDAAFVPTLLKQLEDLAVQTHNRVLAVQPMVQVQAPTRLQQRRDPEAQAKGEEAAKDGAKGEEKKKPEEPYTPLTIQVSLVGGYQSTQAFVQRLTQFPKIIAVEELQLRPHHAEDRQADLLDVEVKLTAYVMKEKAPARPALTASADTGGTTGTGRGGVQ
jgi:hypothetical protein